MKNVTCKDKWTCGTLCWQKRFKFFSAVEIKKVQTSDRKWNGTLDIEKLLLPSIVGSDSGSCYSKQLLHSAYTEQLVLCKSVNSHAGNLWHGSYILIKKKIWGHFLEDNYFSKYCLKTFCKTSITFLWKWFVLFYFIPYLYSF